MQCQHWISWPCLRCTPTRFLPTPLVPSWRTGCAAWDVLGNITREVRLDPPLHQCNRRGSAYWSRRPREPVDAAAWKTGVLAAEQFAAPVVRLRSQRLESNAALADWVRQHRYLSPTDLDSGESGMALLLLWEVDHGRAFPGQGGGGPSRSLLGFTKRLQARVRADEELRTWLVSGRSQKPLAPGLPASHHMCWSVKIIALPPHEPQGWYEEFVRRWRTYLEELAGAVAPTPLGERPIPADPTAMTSSARPEPFPTAGTLECAPGSSRQWPASHKTPTDKSTTKTTQCSESPVDLNVPPQAHQQLPDRKSVV